MNTNITYVTTPGGEELAILPRAELEELADAVKHTRALAEHRTGKDPGLSAAETRELLAAPSPLAFWRRKRGLTQDELADAAGLAQSYLSQMETGARDGSIAHWRALAQALSVPLEDILP